MNASSTRANDIISNYTPNYVLIIIVTYCAHKRAVSLYLAEVFVYSSVLVNVVIKLLTVDYCCTFVLPHPTLSILLYHEWFTTYYILVAAVRFEPTTPPRRLVF